MQVPPFEAIPDEQLLDDLRQPFPLQRHIDHRGKEILTPTTLNPVLANPVLPINQHRDEIVSALENYGCIIVDSPTGSGKSLELPKDALERDENDKIYVTQPTKLAARLLGERLATELTALGANGAKLVGYRTATEGNSTDKNRIIIGTDQLFAELAMEDALGQNPLMILDEFHMRKIGTDVAFAVCAEKGIKMVISSATINSSFIAKRASELLHQDVSIIRSEGRRYEVTEIMSDRPMGQTIVKTIKDLNENQGILAPKLAVILPGDREIREMRGLLNGRLPRGMKITRVTGESSYRQQQEAIANYPAGSIILGTNVMESSVTVNGLLVAFDGGWRRKGDYGGGVKKLPLEPASQASLDQARGRVGRTMPGFYIRADLEGFPRIPHYVGESSTLRPNQTLPYERPEMERIDLSNVQLRLIASGLSLESLPLITPPRRHDLEDAHRSLRNVGAVTYGDLAATEIGATMAELNIDVQYARMIMEAEKHGKRLTLQMIAAVAALQTKGIGGTTVNSRKWKELTKEKNSDVLAQLDIFMQALTMDDEEKARFDIIDKRFDTAVEVARTLAERLGLEFDDIKSPTELERTRLRNCTLRGYEQLFVRRGKKTFRGIADGERRFITGSSVVILEPRSPQMLMGEAIDIGMMTPNGHKLRRTVKTVTKVDLKLLEEVVPERLSYAPAGYAMEETGRLVGLEDVRFDEYRTGVKRTVSVTASEKTDRFIVNQLLRYYPDIVNENYHAIQEELEDLHDLQRRTEQELNLSKLPEYLYGLLRKRQPSTVLSLQRLSTVITPEDIWDYVDPSLRKRILAATPDVVDVKLLEGQVGHFDASYDGDKVYLSVPPQQVVHLPDDKQLDGRQLLYKVGGHRKALTAKEAKEHFGRESRWYRRNKERQAASDGIAPLYGESSSEDARRVEALSLKATEVIVSHFRRKRYGARQSA